jgi:hypothetical protein
MYWCSNKPDDRSQTEAFFTAVSSVLQPNVRRLVDSCSYYNKSQALNLCLDSFESFVRSQPTTKAFFVPTDTTLSGFVDKVSRNNKGSPYLVGRCLDPFSRRSVTDKGSAALEATMDAYDIISSQLRCLQSWHNFMFAFTELLRTNDDFKPSWDENELFGSMFSALLHAVTIGAEEQIDGSPKLSLERVFRIDALVGQILLIAKHDFGVDFSQLHHGLQAIASTIDSILVFRLDSHEVSRPFDFYTIV